MPGFPPYAGEQNLWAYLHGLFENQGAFGLLGSNSQNTFFVDSTNGNDSQNGRSTSTAFATIGAAVSKSAAGGFIILATGQYDETVTIPRALSNLTIIGVGGRGAAFIEPTTEDAGGMIVNADDVTLYNVGVAAEDETSGVALTITGSRFRAYGCKFEGGADQVVFGPGTVAQEAAGTHGVGADGLLDDCEIAWGTDGLVPTCTDYGAVTQWLIRNCRFHNLTANGIVEAVGSGGSAAVTYRNLVISNCIFDDLEDGTAPTNAYIDLNANNANTGQLVGCYFPQASNGGKVLLSTALHCVGVYFTGGISTGQPS